MDNQNMVGTKFWTETQNNSGGLFDDYPQYGIGYALCVEAVDRQHAVARMRGIIDSYPASSDCFCCGARWFIYPDDEGDAEPSLYGKPLTGGWGIPSYIHDLDGRIEAREVSNG
jgi:hypothetical protein